MSWNYPTKLPPTVSVATALLQRMYTEQTLCDATIEVGDKKLVVHRCVLAVHSSVFARMLVAGLQETHTRVIKITDFQYEPVRALVDYMYMPDKIHDKLVEMNRMSEYRQEELRRGNPHPLADASKSDSSMINACLLTSTIHKCAEDVLALADKYDVKPLKSFCEQLLLNRVNATNLCAMVVVADRFKCDRLMQACKRLLLTTQATVRKSDEWTRLNRDHHQLYDQLLEGLFDLCK